MQFFCLTWYILFSTFIVSYDSSQIIEIDVDLTQLESNVNCTSSLATKSAVFFSIFIK